MENISLSKILMVAALSTSTMVIVRNIINIRQRKRQLAHFKQSQIKNLSNIDKMKNNQVGYFKAKLKNCEENKKNIVKKKVQVRYNEYYLQQPSDVKQIRKLQFFQYFQPIFEKNKFFFVDTSGKQKSFYGIKESVIGDCFIINKQYQRYEQGFLKRVWGGFCNILQRVFDVFRKSKFRDPTVVHISQNRRPFIMGPIIGALHYSIGLITQTYFILKIKFQNGVHDIQILAQSKNSLLGAYQHQISSTKLQTLVIGGFSLILGYILFKDFKKSQIYKDVIRLNQKGKKNWLQKENIGQGKECIICYTNCRNLILFDCKHLIMCYDCWKNLKHEECPICKRHIDSAKIIIQQDSYST